ncbi:MAG: hypothetical protein NC078_10190 [Ruminococcus sp.]|nr:hypothetical protein [Ruminococcus sp.]
MMTGCDYMGRASVNQNGRNSMQGTGSNSRNTNCTMQNGNGQNYSSRNTANPPETVTVSANTANVEYPMRNIPQQNFDTPEMQGSMQMVLSHNIGEYVLVEFLIGTERLMRKQGILYHVGTSYITLYDDQNNNFIVCDIFSVKFVYFYYPGQRPGQNFNSIYNEGN